ncbi:hypothetical protein nACB1_095 [Acinetobacter phage nACB1]|nr:hypothetical protein nACB1_095 [Acinetobacter phage nACB1]
MSNTTESPEMNAISNLMIANNHYTINGLYDLVDSYNHPTLSLALDCVLEEGTINTIIEFFITNPAYYPEAQVQNQMHNQHVLFKQVNDALPLTKYMIH